jgi:16S rRNA (uracil1498-N3)-methyltransferase
VRLHRFHVPPPLVGGGRVVLPEGVGRQLIRVLRARVGERVVLFCGDGREHEAELISVTPPEALVGPCAMPDTELRAPLHVAVALLKGEKLDWVVQKLTELGAARISFLATERTVGLPRGERWERRQERYQRIAVEAAEQSGRVRVPEIGGVTGAADLAAAGAAPAFFLDPEAAAPLGAALRPCPDSALVLVGPEGGFTPAERDAVLAAGGRAVTLGRRVLRAETAAIAAAAVFAAECG